MKILIVGGGGREHALAWAIRSSPHVTELYCAPGNAGIGRIATRVPLDPSRVAELGTFAADTRIDLTVVGPELPITLGIAEEFEGRGLALFGASARAAEIESSKVFAKNLMSRHGIPTASYEVFSSHAEAKRALESRDRVFPLVVKADGLAAGKGVVVCDDRKAAIEAASAMMEKKVHGSAGERIVVEERLEGPEVSYFALCDGKRFVPMVPCQDYKRAADGDKGPNTGGMGGYSPSVHASAEVLEDIRDHIVAPTLEGLASEGRPYKGVLYVGLMLTSSGPRVLEYNARFGDPEAQILLRRLASDIVPALVDAAAGRLPPDPLRWRAESAAAVVLAAEGYPGPPRTGMPISGIPQAESVQDVVVFQAGTEAGPGADPLVAGGRVLAVTALGADPSSAARRAYEGVERIRFDGMHYRKDVARDAAPSSSGSSKPMRPVA